MKLRWNAPRTKYIATKYKHSNTPTKKDILILSLCENVGKQKYQTIYYVFQKW